MASRRVGSKCSCSVCVLFLFSCAFLNSNNADINFSHWTREISIECSRSRDLKNAEKTFILGSRKLKVMSRTTKELGLQVKRMIESDRDLIKR